MKLKKIKPSTSSLRTVHFLATLSGIYLFLTFFGLTQTYQGLKITFYSIFNYSSPGEVYFWLGHALLLFPGACLIGFGISPWLSKYLKRLWIRVEEMNRRELIAGVFAIFVLVFATARLSHKIILLDYPITDDEYAAQFGGQIMALGKIKISAPEPFEAYPKLFLFAKDGWVTSMDWLGVQVAWAIAELTRLGPLVYAIAAAIPAICIALIIGMRFSPGYGLIAFSLFFFSPMAFILSMTTHAHLLSRAMLGLTLLFYFLARQKSSLIPWILTGLSAGIGFCCRPIETTSLLFPLFLYLVVRDISKKNGLPKATVGLLIGSLFPLVIFGLHNWLVTGSYYLPARFSSGSFGNILATGSFWNRFGGNTSYNLFMLAIWFLGPLGILLISFGIGTNRFTRLLGLGVAALLAAGCFHDNHGIHIVGPIHYSECVVPLVIIAVHGFENIKRKLNRHGISFLIPASTSVCVLLLGLGTFNIWHSLALHRQAHIQHYIYSYIENTINEKNIQKAIILAPQFGNLWRASKYFASIGSWVFEWRRVKPDFSDEIMILHDVPNIKKQLRKNFPDRVFLRLRPTKEPPFFELIPLIPNKETGVGSNNYN